MLITNLYETLKCRTNVCTGSRAVGQVNRDPKALQFRGGWYVLFNPSDITRFMRLLEFHKDKDAPKTEDGTGTRRG